jgi:hypothetical protein
MSNETSESTEMLPAATIQRLRELRRALLHLHKVLLDMERADFERLSGRLTSGEVLQLVINHPQFAWLRRISALVVEMDEMLSAEEPATQSDVDNLLEQARLLFSSAEDKEFKEKFQAALQREPAAVMAHSEMAKFLRNEQSVPRSKAPMPE